MYYILVPVIAVLWAITAGLVLYPKSLKNWEENKAEYAKAQELMDELVALQPERLNYKMDVNAPSEEFDFTKTVSEFAGKFSILPSDYNLTVRSEVSRAGRKTRSATMSIKAIDIEKMTQFLSALLLRWPDLQCDRMSIDKVKNSKNSWQVELALTYYY